MNNPPHDGHSSRKEYDRIYTVSRKALRISPNVLTFDLTEVGSRSSPLTAIITNDGDRSVRINGVQKAGEYALSHNAPDVLRAGESFKASVIFLPKAVGMRTGSIHISTDDADGDDYIPLNGFAMLGGDTGTDPGNGGGTPPDPGVDNSLKANAAAIGIQPAANHLGTFDSAYIADDVSVKTALIALSQGLSQVSGRVEDLEDYTPDPNDPNDPAVGSGLVGFLTNESHTVVANSVGTVISYSGATGNFVIFHGTDDVSSLFDIQVLANPQNLEVTVTGQTYTVTGGLDESEDSATVRLRATGTTLFNGIRLDKVFTLSKTKGGANAKFMSVLSDKQAVTFSAEDAPDPVNQVINFSVNRQNTTVPVIWAVADINGVNKTPASNYLSDATGDAVSMTVAQFNSARGSTNGVIVTGTITDGNVVLTDRISVVKVRAGAKGNDGIAGIDGFDGSDGKWVEFVWRRAATKPATPSGRGIPSGWTDEPVAGTDPLWMSVSKQELDGSLVAGTDWSEPVRHDGPAGPAGGDAFGYIQETTPGTPVSVKQMWYKPSTKALHYWSGTAWVLAGGTLSQLDKVLAEHIGANTIAANHLTTNQLLTASAQIGDGLIRNAKIGDLEVSRLKIVGNAIDTSKIESQAVTHMWGWNAQAVQVYANNTPVIFFEQSFTSPALGLQFCRIDLSVLTQHGNIIGGDVSGNFGVDHVVNWYLQYGSDPEYLFLSRNILETTRNSYEHIIQDNRQALAEGQWTIRGKITVRSGATDATYRVHSAAVSVLGFRR